jgi:hypothetical protein
MTAQRASPGSLQLDCSCRAHKGLPNECTVLQQLVRTELTATEHAVPVLWQTSEWMYQAAHFLVDAVQSDGEILKREYQRLLASLVH